MPPITFTIEDFQGIDPDKNDLMVITVEVANFTVMKTLVDQGSSVAVLSLKTFSKLGLPSEVLTPFDEQIVGFLVDKVDTRGYADLYTKFGDGERQKDH